jgi:hypothetical protein
MTESHGQADNPTPAMILAGVYALQDFGSYEDFSATSPELIVSAVFSAMQRAALPVPDEACEPRE